MREPPTGGRPASRQGGESERDESGSQSGSEGSVARPRGAGAHRPRPGAGADDRLLRLGPGKVSLPVGVAVDQSNGDLYVADRRNFRIDRFDSEGRFELAWGWGVADGTSQELQSCGPAVLPEGTKRCFAAAREAGGNTATGPGAVTPGAVAVAREGEETFVYVADASNRRVSKFSADGRLLYMVGRNVNLSKAAEEGPAAPYTQAEKNICTAADLEAGERCGRAQSGAGPDEFTNPLSLAVVAGGADAGRVWVGDSDRLAAIEPGGGAGPEVEPAGGGETGSLALDSAGDFYTVRPGTDEAQTVGFEGIGINEQFTFKLGDLPAASCAQGETGAIGPLSLGGGAVLQAEVEEALQAAGCGDDFSLSAGSSALEIFFVKGLAARDLDELTCTVLGETGGCAAETVEDGSEGTVEKYDPAGALLGTMYTGAPEALALDAAGNIYVGDKRNYHFAVLEPSGEQVSQFGAGQVVTNVVGAGPLGNALALEEGGEGRPPTLYAASSRADEGSAVQAFEIPAAGPLPQDEQVKEGSLLPTAATLAARLNAENEQTAYHFEYDTSPYAEGEPEGEHGTAVPEPDAEVAASFEEVGVQAEVSGLIPGTTYHFRLCAANASGAICGPDTAFETRTAVGIEAEWASSATAREASVDATLDPLGAANASWGVEYDTSPYAAGEGPHGSAVTGGALPESFGALHRQAALGGLAPATTYHYRFVAEGEQDGHRYTVRGPDRSFTTQPAGLGAALPDGRAWEMVTPPDKHGAAVKASRKGQVQAAADGEALAYLTLGSIEADPQGNRLPVVSSALARRGAHGAWSNADISPPHREIASLFSGTPPEYKLFDAGLGRALMDPADATPLSPAADEWTPYVRENSSPPTYTPLVSAANTAPGSEFGEKAKVSGATPDLRHVLLSSSVPLTAGVSGSALYEWSAGALTPVSVLPEGEGGGAVFGEAGSGTGSVRGAVSEDGSRVFFTTIAGRLYVRDLARGQSARLDVAQPGAFGTGAAAPRFQAAAADGSVALFTDTRNLTADANESGADLYRCEVAVEEGELGCRLSDLTAETRNPEDPFESAEVLGGVPGA